MRWGPSTRTRPSRPCSRRRAARRAPWRLALVTVVQFAEDLSDRQAADAVRARIDLKYALALPLEDAGFDHTVLSEFRSRLVAGEAAHVLLEALLERCRRLGLLKAHGRQRTDSTHVLAAVRALNRLELVRETLGHTLEVLAGAVPDWLRAHALPEWVRRYQGRCDELRLPKGKAARQALGTPSAPTERHCSERSPRPRPRPGCGRSRRWRPCGGSGCRTTCPPWRACAGGRRRRGSPGRRSSSLPPRRGRPPRRQGHPRLGRVQGGADRDVRGRRPQPHHPRRDRPRPDRRRDPHAARSSRASAAGAAPRVHLVDSGFLDAALLVASRRDFGVDLLGPTRRTSVGRPARGRLRRRALRRRLGQRRVTCPAGHTSIQWTPRCDSRDNDSIDVRFSPSDCGPCPSLRRCTQTADKHPRWGPRTPPAGPIRGAAPARTRRAAPPSRASTPGGRGSRAPSPRASGAAGCGGRATWACPGRTSATSRPPPRLTSCAWPNSWRGPCGLAREGRTSRGSWHSRDAFATSIKRAGRLLPTGHAVPPTRVDANRRVTGAGKPSEPLIPVFGARPSR